MSDLGDPQLEELDPLEDGDATGAPPAGAVPPGAAAPAMNVRMLSGLPTPAFNPQASKEYYRFLFCGVLIVLGCLMPFGPDYAGAGYKSFMGGIHFLIGLGMIWSAWAGISVNKPSMKWIMLGFVPAVWGIMKLVEGDRPRRGRGPARSPSHARPGRRARGDGALRARAHAAVTAPAAARRRRRR